MWKTFNRFSGILLGISLTLLFALLKVIQGHATFEGKIPFLMDLDNSVNDIKFRIRGGPATEEELKTFQKGAHVVIAAIDEKSMRMEDLGMWPWPHVKLATLVNNTIKCGAKAIGFDAIFAEPDSSRTLPVLVDLMDRYQKAGQQDEDFQKTVGTDRRIRQGHSPLRQSA